MAVPKRRTSKSKKRHRKSHDKLTPPALTLCPQCGARVMSHRICDACGFYRGKTYKV